MQVEPRFKTVHELSPIASHWEWQNQGECRKHDSNLFFLEENLRGAEKQRKVAAAKAICAPCPVKDKCLQHALSTPENYGVWGGFSEEERAEIMKRRGTWRLGNHIHTSSRTR